MLIDYNGHQAIPWTHVHSSSKFGAPKWAWLMGERAPGVMACRDGNLKTACHETSSNVGTADAEPGFLCH